jgi:hypothetical protein
VAEVTASVPALDAKATVAPDIATLLVSFAVTVIVAVVLPSGGTLATLLETASEETVVVPPPLVVVPLEVEVPAPE